MHSIGRGHVCDRARAVHNLFNSGGRAEKAFPKPERRVERGNRDIRWANESDFGGKRAVEGKPVRSCGCGRASFLMQSK